MLKKIGIAIVVLIAGLVAVGLFLPHDYEVERGITIQREPQRVFDEVNSLKNWEAWSPWVAKDSTIKSVYSGPDSGVGATASWTSENSGSGKQEVLESQAPSHIKTKLDFGDMGFAYTQWHFEPAENGTNVRWSMSGDTTGLFGGYFAMMMDSFIGADYEDGLSRLKQHLESEAAPAQ